jgi:DHA1 family inner membrane transport protein
MHEHERADDMASMVLPLFLVVFVVYFDHNFASPALDSIARSLHVPLESGGYIIAVYSCCAALGAVLCGPLSDRFGRKAMLQGGLVAFGVFSSACGLAWDFASMQWFRALCGLAGGVLISNAVAYVADHCAAHGDEKQLTHAMGKVMAGVFFALVVGVPIGLLITGVSNWRWPFVAAGVLGVALLWPIRRLPHIETGATGLSYLASLRQSFALGRSPERALLLGIFAMQLLPMGLIVYVPNWFIRHGVSVQQLAIICALASVGSTAAAVYSGRMAERLGARKLLVSLNFIMAATAVAMVGVPFNVLTESLLFALYSACLSARLAQMQAHGMKQVPLSERGRFSSLVNAAMQLGATAGVAGVTWSMTHFQLTLETDGIRFIALCAAGLLLLTGLACLALEREPDLSAKLA